MRITLGYSVKGNDEWAAKTDANNPNILEKNIFTLDTKQVTGLENEFYLLDHFTIIQLVDHSTQINRRCRCKKAEIRQMSKMAPLTTNLTNQPLGSVQQECYEQNQEKGMRQIFKLVYEKVPPASSYYWELKVQNHKHHWIIQI